MNWQEVCEHPSLKDLPFKIELDEFGRIIMSPVKLLHSALRGEIGFLLFSFLQNGKTLSNCAIKTSKGTKVADVAWFPSDSWVKIKDEFDASIAPDICVEVISTGNIVEKRQLYFEAGAKEVWMCDEQGLLSFFNAEQQLERSILVPEFPEKLDV